MALKLETGPEELSCVSPSRYLVNFKATGKDEGGEEREMISGVIDGGRKPRADGQSRRC